MNPAETASRFNQDWWELVLSWIKESPDDRTIEVSVEALSGKSVFFVVVLEEKLSDPILTAIVSKGTGPVLNEACEQALTAFLDIRRRLQP